MTTRMMRTGTVARMQQLKNAHAFGAGRGEEKSTLKLALSTS